MGFGVQNFEHSKALDTYCHTFFWKAIPLYSLIESIPMLNFFALLPKKVFKKYFKCFANLMKIIICISLSNLTFFWYIPWLFVSFFNELLVFFDHISNYLSASLLIFRNPVFLINICCVLFLLCCFIVYL